MKGNAIVDRARLREHLERRLRTHVTAEAAAAMAHSLECVTGQFVEVARRGLRADVARHLDAGSFQGIPDLEPRHFLAIHQGTFESLQVPGRPSPPGPSVEPRR